MVIYEDWRGQGKWRACIILGNKKASALRLKEMFYGWKKGNKMVAVLGWYGKIKVVFKVFYAECSTT